MEKAIKIIEAVDEFLKSCEIFQEMYLNSDGFKTLYLYIQNDSKKVYFYCTTFQITPYDDESLGPLTRQDAKHLLQPHESQNLLNIRSTYCSVNGYGFSVILQAKILALGFLNDCLIAKKDDMTDASSTNSVRNINHILSFWNPEYLHLIHTTDDIDDPEEYQKHIDEYTADPIAFDEESDDSDTEDEYTPGSDTEDDADADEDEDEDSTDNEAEPDLKICVPDSTKYAIIAKSCAHLVTMFEWYLPEKQAKFTALLKKDLLEIIPKNKKNGVWEFMEPCAEVGVLE
jgi:hypothetical protein